MVKAYGSKKKTIVTPAIYETQEAAEADMLLFTWFHTNPITRLKQTNFPVDELTWDSIPGAEWDVVRTALAAMPVEPAGGQIQKRRHGDKLNLNRLKGSSKVTAVPQNYEGSPPAKKQKFMKPLEEMGQQRQRQFAVLLKDLLDKFAPGQDPAAIARL